MALLVATFAGCVSEPEIAERGLGASVRHLLAFEFSPGRTAERAQKLHAVSSALSHELRRPIGLPATAAAMGTELRRTGNLLDHAGDTVRSELGRRPNATIERLTPSRHELAQDTSDGLDLMLYLLGPSNHPLGEIDDREHRTDHRDDRPERTLWQRLRRRLQL